MGSPSRVPRPMSTSSPVRVGLVGAGFLAETRVRCYRRLAGVAEVVAVCARRPERARAFRRALRAPQGLRGRGRAARRPGGRPRRALRAQRPSTVRSPVEAARAGKHIVCTKPLTAYVGQDLAGDASDEDVAGTEPERMLAVALDDAQAMVDAAREAGVILGYAGELGLRAFDPALRRARPRRGRSAARAARLGVPLGLALVVLEALAPHRRRGAPEARGAPGRRDALAQAARGPLARRRADPPGERDRRGRGPDARARRLRPTTSPLGGGWVDVENWGTLTIAFEDGARGVAYGSDNLLGGMESRLEVAASNAAYRLQPLAGRPAARLRPRRPRCSATST